MTKAIVKNAAEFKSLRQKLDFPAWVRSPITYPCAFVWAWANDGLSFQCELVYPGDFTQADTREVKLQNLIAIVAKACGFDTTTVTGPSQHRQISDARAIVCHEARKRAYTFKEIGAALNRTHKSVYVMQEKYSTLKQYDQAFDKLTRKCEHALEVAFL